MLIKIVAVQARMGQPLTLEEKLYIFRQRPDFVCLPEYWSLDKNLTDFHRAALAALKYKEQLAQLSDELDTILIGGSIVEAKNDALYNSAQVFNRGQAIGSYRKINPVEGELEKGITPGVDYVVINSGSVKFGVMLCSDVFYSKSFNEMARLEPDIIFIPTISPYRPADSLTAKKKRDLKYYQNGASITGSFVVKVCGVGEFMGQPLQGRSLITSPWEILKRVNVNSESSHMILSATLDILEIRDFRKRMKRNSDQLSQIVS